jgi:hypothetical protein
LAGVGIGVLLFGNPAALLGAAIGVTAMVILRAVRRRVDP